MKLPVFCLILLLPTMSLAGDGVLEINQTCAVQTGCFAGDSASFPVEITAPGSYILTSNLIVRDENTSGILVSSSDVGIDLNNFAIIRSGCEGTSSCSPAPGTGSGVERVSTENRGTSVKNGSITGMGNHGVFLGAQAEVTNLRARSNQGDGINAGSGSTVSGNTALLNGNDGINVGTGSTVSGNTAFNSGNRGIFANSGSTVSGNTAYQNRSDGIDGGSGCTIIGNTAYDNGDSIDPALDDGIKCNDGCTVRGNTVRDNSGFGLNLGSFSSYRENTITDNATGTVTGGTNLGGNLCHAPGAPGATMCP